MEGAHHTLCGAAWRSVVVHHLAQWAWERVGHGHGFKVGRMAISRALCLKEYPLAQ